MKNFDEEFQIIMDELTRIAQIENNFTQMAEYIKMPKRLEAIWKEGFEAGCKKVDDKINES